MLATPNVTIQEPRDFGQRIAAEYWQRTPHVFSSEGQKNPCCGLCLVADTGQHRERESYAPNPTFVRFEGYSGYLSCGHGPVGIGGMRTRPVVGQEHECWDCQRPIDERNRPGLPGDIRAQIEAQLPKCPKCGSPIEKIPFIKRTVHKYQADVDFQTGEILAGSEHDDTLEEDPDWHVSRYVRGEPIRELEVECANGHSWFETRLKYEYDRRSDEHIWVVLPPEGARS